MRKKGGPEFECLWSYIVSNHIFDTDHCRQIEGRCQLSPRCLSNFWAHKTSLIPPLLTEVPVIIPECERPCHVFYSDIEFVSFYDFDMRQRGMPKVQDME